jgi:hypothetical protein
MMTETSGACPAFIRTSAFERYAIAPGQVTQPVHLEGGEPASGVTRSQGESEHLSERVEDETQSQGGVDPRK